MTTHQHEYHHDENCGCGNHEHHHDENCGCGNHEHHHDENCGCGNHGNDKNGFYIEQHQHEGACVVSGTYSLFAEYDTVKATLEKSLGDMAQEVNRRGGIIGHIKSSAEIKSVEMFSVTDLDVMVKKAPGQDITLHIAAIVFMIEPDDVQELLEVVFSDIKKIVEPA